MAIGKKEQIAIVSIGALAAIGAVHFFIFSTKAKDYKSVTQKYNESVQKLESAEFITETNQQAFETYKADTVRYKALESSVTQALNLIPLDLSTSASVANVDQWASRTLQLLKQIADFRGLGAPRLTFLEAKREWEYPSNNQNQGRTSRGRRGMTANQQMQPIQVSGGWNLPRQLPGQASPAQLRDISTNLIQFYRFIQSTNDINQKLNSRSSYNLHLAQMGIDPVEVSNYQIPHNGRWLYFNDENWFNELATLGQNYTSYAQPAQRSSAENPLGLYKLGPAIPALKKLHFYGLIKERVGNAPELLNALGEALELNIPLDTNALDVTNKQLETLVYIIQLAGKHQITEITKVKFLRPTNFDKAVNRVPGVVPTPDPNAAAPADPAAMAPMMDPMMMDPMMMDPMMMGDMGSYAPPTAGPTPIPDESRIAAGSGVEIYFRAANTNSVRFLYELTHGTKTYSIDDLSFDARTADGILESSATIELITEVGPKQGGGAAPVDPAAEGVM